MTDRIISINPVTQEAAGNVRVTEPDKINKILKKSVASQQKWQELSVAKRAGILREVRKQLVK